ncbi:4-(cytidine 5'-diphospho)-2-C-methyl-D-erythritol kinase [Helicobacter salomonis]|uniref:4-(cytidine 5'-diphospho)-2-C-methyl-D-erythritol kinase n=1 Tax=Helicobacter salomonis TaxID=56878 RepID=UPI000CF08DB5|nr:4-(cytidine 5'-diphospho)-2-C-methyl-D-erythritol kinase [Helicobacter salomonis]
MNAFSFEVYPKVNIFLKILGRERGYHTLVSRLVLVKNSFRDHISIKNARTFALKGDFDCPVQSNTLYKALQALRSHMEFRNVKSSLLRALDSLEIEVEKHIPTQAGFGGGSANAGGLLRHLNTHLELGLTLDELYHVGMRVGSDVNFFISGLEYAHVSHFGEIVESCQDMPLELELLASKIACKTSEVYQAFGQTQPIPLDLNMLKNTHSAILLQNHTRSTLNDLLQAALKVVPALQELETNLATRWFFSGSGSGFFALKENRV